MKRMKTYIKPVNSQQLFQLSIDELAKMAFLVNWIIKYISQKIFRETKWNKFGYEDPYFDVYEIEQHSFLTGAKTLKKVKKAKEIPAGISVNDANVLRKVIRRAYHLDMLFNFAGYRIGFSGLIGLIPVVGDVAGVIFSLLLFHTARQVDGGLPFEIQLRILANILIDFVLGLIPILGDFIEVLYKANSRNALILEKHLHDIGELKISDVNVTGQSEFGLDSLDGSTGYEFESLTTPSVTDKPRPRKAKTTFEPLDVGKGAFEGEVPGSITFKK